MNNHLVDCLKNNYNIVATSLMPLNLGADRDASLYIADTEGGGSYFVKLKRGDHSDTYLKLVAFLQAAGIENLISPVKAMDGTFTQKINNMRLVVYPFIRGDNGFNKPLSKNQWLTLGKALRQVHEIKLPPSIKDQIRIEAFSDKSRKAIHSIMEGIDRDPGVDEIANKFKAYLKGHKETILRLVNRAEALSQMIQSEPSEFVLCHSDIHAGNVLIDEKDSIYIVDWDEPIMAPKERDLMFIGGGVANVWNNPHEEALFYTGYGKTSINRVILAFYRHERIVQDIVEFAEGLLFKTEEESVRREMYKHFLGLFEPNGVVEIAFKTDDGYSAL